jgi:hypothetical protein
MCSILHQPELFDNFQLVLFYIPFFLGLAQNDHPTKIDSLVTTLPIFGGPNATSILAHMSKLNLFKGQQKACGPMPQWHKGSPILSHAMATSTERPLVPRTARPPTL